MDKAGGHFKIAPQNALFSSDQSYLESTNILQTCFVTATGQASLIDFFSVRDRQKARASLWPDQEILRIIETTDGEIEFSLDFLPRSNYGKNAIQLSWIGNWGIQCTHGRKILLLQASLPGTGLKLHETPEGLCATASFRLRAGQKAVVSLTYSDEAPAVLPNLDGAWQRLADTREYWKNWVKRCRYEGPNEDRVRRSALALKLLNFAPSGAFIAAPTTSLPEHPGGTRNWDYRFCWLRDASFTVRALLHLGFLEEAKGFLNWLLHSTRLSWPRLQVLYSVYGESRLEEREAAWLGGYRNSRPVRIGNEASKQIQLDVYGEVIDSFFSLSSHLDPIDRETQRMVIGFGKAVAELWSAPDQGIWEFRSAPKHYTHSKLMCWVAMDRLAQLSDRYGWKLPYDARKTASRIQHSIESFAYDAELRSYTRAFGDPALDASLLVMPLVGYCDPKDPRFVSMRERIIRNLCRNELIYRYEPGSDGFPEPEGSFAICNFWLAEGFAMAGEYEEAEKWFSAITRRLNSTALAPEELDPFTDHYLGNYPQGFSHIGLINAALAMRNRSSRPAAERMHSA